MLSQSHCLASKTLPWFATETNRRVGIQFASVDEDADIICEATVEQRIT